MGRDLNARLDKSISTSALNKLIGDMWNIASAKIKGNISKVFYAVQVENRPLGPNFFVIENIN